MWRGRASASAQFLIPLAPLASSIFAKKSISAILENADLSFVPRDRADAAMCLLGRRIRELAEATEAQTHAASDIPAR